MQTSDRAQLVEQYLKMSNILNTTLRKSKIRTHTDLGRAVANIKTATEKVMKYSAAEKVNQRTQPTKLINDRITVLELTGSTETTDVLTGQAASLIVSKDCNIASITVSSAQGAQDESPHE